MGILYFDNMERVWRTLSPNGMLRDFSSFSDILAYIGDNLRKEDTKTQRK